MLMRRRSSRICETYDIMSTSEPTCLHDWRAANWIMIVATATESTVGANHDIMSSET